MIIIDCPFCGERGEKIRCIQINETSFRIVCTCKAYGPPREGYRAAIIAWNSERKNEPSAKELAGALVEIRENAGKKKEV